MCYPVRCSVCDKTGWDGCGEHVDSVMGPVPPNQRCTCSKSAARAEAGSAPYSLRSTRHR